jgi:hypothetical protein
MAEISGSDGLQGDNELRHSLSSSAASGLTICPFQTAVLQEACTLMARFYYFLFHLIALYNYKSYITSVERLGDLQSLEEKECARAWYLRTINYYPQLLLERTQKYDQIKCGYSYSATILYFEPSTSWLGRAYGPSFDSTHLSVV